MFRFNVIYDGIRYPSTEHAYQAAKTVDPGARELIRCATTPGKSRRIGNDRSVTVLRDGWDDLKLIVMGELCRQKFTVVRYATLLASTGTARLIEGNNWHDVFYGVCTGCRRYNCDGVGANELGMLLMEIRSNLDVAGPCTSKHGPGAKLAETFGEGPFDGFAGVSSSVW